MRERLIALVKSILEMATGMEADVNLEMDDEEVRQFVLGGEPSTDTLRFAANYLRDAGESSAAGLIENLVIDLERVDDVQA